MNFMEQGKPCPDGYIGVIGDDSYADDAENRAILDLCDKFNGNCAVCPHSEFCNTTSIIIDCLASILNRKHLNMDITQNEKDLETLTNRLSILCGIPLNITFGGMDDSKFPPEPVFEEEEKTGTKAAEQPASDDPVNSPKHYCQGGIECIDVIEAARGREGCIQFCLGNAIKYLFRDQYKGRPLEDLKKAQWYINKAISLMEGE